MIGTHIGSYQIERELGRGGFGVVYIGVDTRLGRRAAIKQLLPELSSNRQIVERFFNEAKAAASINHPGIVEIYDVGWHTDGSAYFAMKLLGGESLARRLRATGPMAFQLAATIGRQVASALVAAHARDIVHRDLKPDNIILVPDDEIAIGERAVVLDFGIAKLGGGQGMSNTRSGMMMGTPAYMSPEQCRGAGEVDHRTDIYALGCILFEMLTCRTPFVGEGPGEIMGMHQFVDAPSVTSLRPDTPPELEALISQLLVKKVDQRMQQMTAVQAVLQNLAGKPSREHQVATPSTPLPVSPVAPTAVSQPQRPIDPVSDAARIANQPPQTTAPSVEVDLDASGVKDPPTTSTARSYVTSMPELVPGPDAVNTTLSSSRGEVTPASGKPRSKTGLIAVGGFAIAAIIAGIVIASSSGRSSTTPGLADAAIAVAPDAATAVVDAAIAIAPDATPSPDGPDKQPLVHACTEAQTRQRWTDLESCGLALAKLDPAAGQPFLEVAKREALAELHLRDLRVAVKAKNVKTAESTYAKIPKTSVYHADAKDLLRTLAASTTSTGANVTTRRLPGGYACTPGTADTINGTCKCPAGYTAKRDPQDFAICVGSPPVRSSAITGYECPPGVPLKDVGCKCPATHVSRVSDGIATCIAAPRVTSTSSCDPATVEETHAKANTAQTSGSYAAALQLYESILACKPTVVQAAYLAACRSRNFPKAKRYFIQLGNEALAQICLKEGFDPRP